MLTKGHIVQLLVESPYDREMSMKDKLKYLYTPRTILDVWDFLQEQPDFDILYKRRKKKCKFTYRAIRISGEIMDIMIKFTTNKNDSTDLKLF